MTNNVSENIKTVGTYLGYFTVGKHTTNKNNKKPSKTYERLFFTAALERKDYLAMGDIVYGMYVNNQLVKIGKAGSSHGWAGRIQTYGVNPKGEATNRKIITCLREMYNFETKVEVYGVQVAREKVEYFCNITGETVILELPKNGAVETYLTAIAEDQLEDLVFCTQKI